MLSKSISVSTYLVHHNILAITENKDFIYFENLLHWQTKAKGAFAKKSWQSFEYDWPIFLRFCRCNEFKPLPAEPETIRLFILSLILYIKRTTLPDEIHADIKTIEQELGKARIIRSIAPRKIATVRRYVSTIATAHKAANAPNPVDTETVKLALKKAARVSEGNQTQRKPIRKDEIRMLRQLDGVSLRGQQDIMITLVGYETGIRCAAISRIAVEDIAWQSDGSAHIFIWRDKTDLENKGHWKYLSPDTSSRIRYWLDLNRLETGPVFRGILGNSKSIKGKLLEKAISGESIRNAMKRCMNRIGKDTKLIGAHSTRIGGAQDIREANFSMIEIMAYGGWKSPAMPMKYTEKLDVKETAMAKLLGAKKQDNI